MSSIILNFLKKTFSPIAWQTERPGINSTNICRKTTTRKTEASLSNSYTWTKLHVCTSCHTSEWKFSQRIIHNPRRNVGSKVTFLWWCLIRNGGGGERGVAQLDDETYSCWKLKPIEHESRKLKLWKSWSCPKVQKATRSCCALYTKEEKGMKW